MIKKCRYCGKEFDAFKTTIFCSDECRHEQKLKYAREYNYEFKGMTPLHETECIVCGKTFMQHSGRQKCCSPECMKERKRDYYKRSYLKKKLGKEKPKKKNKTMPTLDDMNEEQLLNYAKIQLETIKDQLTVKIPTGLMKVKDRQK